MLPCDLCGETEGLPLSQADKFGSGGVFVCAGCGFVHVKERRSAQEVAAAWDAIYGEGYTSAWPAVWARLQYVAEWYDQKHGWKDKDVLEIGAGEGTFLKIVRDRGARPVGLEPFDKNVEKMQEDGITAVHATIEDASAKPGFDVVCILWTLENCSDCIGMLKKAREFLNPGGHVLVATGSRILVPFKKPISTYFSDNPPDTHCFRWSEASLHNAFRKAGLGRRATNNFMECDWMVALAETGFAPPLEDDPEAVLAYFDAWERLPI